MGSALGFLPFYLLPFTLLLLPCWKMQQHFKTRGRGRGRGREREREREKERERERERTV